MNKTNITRIQALEVLDSRGNPTVQATVWVGDIYASASVPSGASTGTYEALELRDKDPKRYGGLGVLKAVKNLDTIIAKELSGFDVVNQEKIDKKLLDLDGTENKSKLGANAILAVSMAASRASAIIQGKELYVILAKYFDYTPKSLPIPMMNVINGGAHADSGLDIQEYMIVPKGKVFKNNLRTGAEIYHVLKKQLQKQNQSVAVGDEGGFAPHLKGNETGCKELVSAIKTAGYIPGKDVFLAIDAAASEFYDKARNQYVLKCDNKKLKSSQLAKVYNAWIKKYPLISLEDIFAEDDFEPWANFTKSMGKNVGIVGDDLFVTNVERLQMGIDQKLANSILVKLNQIGTVTETINAIKLAQRNKFKVIISHRSGETSDTYIADLAVAVNAEYIKTGSLSRGERTSKYNRLLEIENQLIK